MASRATLVHCAPLDFRRARVSGLARIPFEKGLFKGSGTLCSPTVDSDFPFDNMVGSWNARLPEGASVQLDVQVRAGGNWSKWHGLGRWDDSGGRNLGAQADELGSVDVDTLKLSRKADAFRYRMRLEGTRGRPPVLDRVAVTYADSTAAPRGWAAAPEAPPFQTGPWVRELRIRPRSQMEEQEKYKNDICGPTALSMVLDYWGKNYSTMRVATAAQDGASRLYGNWTINVAAASILGLRGHVARLEGLRDLQDEIATGRPVVVSVTFEPGELSGAPLEKTRGHLLVVCGFTDQGDVIAADPAAPDNKSVRRVYRRGEFAKVWLENKLGLAYVLGPALPAKLAVGVPAAALRQSPKVPRSPSPRDPGRLSELLLGEAVLALRIKGDRVRVRALEQIHLYRKSWLGYAGWISGDALAGFRVEPNAVVRSKQARLRPAGIVLSMGTKLRVESVSGPECRVRLSDGRAAAASSSDINLLDAPFKPSAEGVLRAAGQLIGDAYVWGGRSGAGVDCSGLTSLSYRAQGIDLPRDAHDQFLRARPVKRADLRPGDLVFLSRPGAPKKINHVLLYAGGEELLESRQSPGGGGVVKTTFQARFGKPLARIESGDRVTAAVNDRPARRAIYFGSYLHG